MKLALRKNSPVGAPWYSRLFNRLVKIRLVSQYCHGAIIHEGRIYQITGKNNFTIDDFSHHDGDWDFYEIAPAVSIDDAAGQCLKVAYDWFSLLAFVGLNVRDSSRMYCFEFCYYVMTGEQATKRITPEALLALRG